MNNTSTAGIMDKGVYTDLKKNVDRPPGENRPPQAGYPNR